MIETGLKGKVVIVTGAAAGIGRGTAERFAEEGCRVAAWDVTDAHADELVAELGALGGEAVFSQVNVTNVAAVEAAVAEVVGRWGGVDVLVNNAGIVRDAQLVKVKDGEVVATMTDDQWDAVVGVNLKGVFNCTRAVAPHLIRAGGGVVLNASSVACLNGNFGQTNYVATKAGVIGMTRTWAREFGRYGIRVNAVAPGFVLTEILKAMPQKVLDGMVGHTPLGRIGDVRDIANAYLWLASDAASWITGATLSVDGGLVIGT
ncbi:MAG: SDR family oxidoreductase [Thermoanaerobaculales bacterium]|jgi:3-oxoacyl-[acyl-carrier protein] reductase|nr:SDR family oxidoreductase [Thermoanaerobaculales bacterium]